MRVEAFRQRVMKYEDYHLSRQSLSEAVDFYLEQRPPDESGISACIQLANFVERSHLNRRAAELWSPAILLPSHLLLEKVDPWVRRVRWQIFHGGWPPFTSYREAVEWLVQEGNEQEMAWLQRHARRPRRAKTMEIGIDPNWRILQRSEARRIIIEPAPKDPVQACYSDGKQQLEGLWHVDVTRREIPYKTSDEACIPVSQRDGYEYVRQMFPTASRSLDRRAP